MYLVYWHKWSEWKYSSCYLFTNTKCWILLWLYVILCMFQTMCSIMWLNHILSLVYSYWIFWYFVCMLTITVWEFLIITSVYIVMKQSFDLFHILGHMQTTVFSAYTYVSVHYKIAVLCSLHSVSVDQCSKALKSKCSIVILQAALPKWV
jgi:hypothetical protein